MISTLGWKTQRVYIKVHYIEVLSYKAAKFFNQTVKLIWEITGMHPEHQGQQTCVGNGGICEPIVSKTPTRCDKSMQSGGCRSELYKKKVARIHIIDGNMPDYC